MTRPISPEVQAINAELLRNRIAKQAFDAETQRVAKEETRSLTRAEAESLLEEVIGTLIEVGNGVTDEMLHESCDYLFAFRDRYFNKDKIPKCACGLEDHHDGYCNSSVFPGGLTLRNKPRGQER